MGRVVGYGVSQVPTNGMLGGMAYQDPINVTVNNISVGRLYDANNNVGTGTSVLVSTGIGVSWIAIATAALQGVQGVQGTQGVQGIQGTLGAQGTLGTQGTTGTQGTLGTQGTQGVQGTTGTTGSTGGTGAQGTTGSTGGTGTQGTLGTQGATGPTGGSSGQVLYNSGGTATSSSNLTFDGTTFKYNNGYGSAATAYGCRAWVNFDGQGTYSPNPSTSKIRASGNVSSITDNGTGSHTVNFTTAMSDENYCVTFSAQSLDGCGGYGTNSARTTTSVGVNTRNGSNNQTDRASISVAIFR